MVTQLPIKFFMSAVTNSFQKGAHSAPDFSPLLRFFYQPASYTTTLIFP